MHIRGGHISGQPDDPKDNPNNDPNVDDPIKDVPPVVKIWNARSLDTIQLLELVIKIGNQIVKIKQTWKLDRLARPYSI